MLIRRPRELIAIVLLMAASACHGDRSRVEGAVYSWLQCQDCMHQQRARVIALGDSAVPLLATILIQGPPPAHDAAYVATLHRLAQQTQSITPAIIEHQRALFAAVYRRRALSALQGIGSSSARSAMCLARASTPPAAALAQALDSTLTTIGAACP
jgi:hypothetical protein